MMLNKNQWACPIPDYSDDQKKEHDYEETKANGCLEKELADPDTCTFVTTTTTTTGPGIGANVFTEHLVYSHSKCELDTIVLHDIMGEVGCADEAWTNEGCGLWYSFNSLTHHCECVAKGKKCKKISDPSSSVYKIEDLRDQTLKGTRAPKDD